MKNTVKKIGLTFVLVMSMALLVACGGNDNAGNKANDESKSNGDKITIRMGNQVDENNFLNQGYVKFKEIIEEKSDGQFEVEIYNGGTLVSSDEEIVEALKNGTLDLSTSSAYGTANTTDVSALKLFDMPMLFDNRDQFYSLLDGEYGENIKQEIDGKTNLQVLGFIDLGSYGILNGKKSVEKPEDLKSLKIRTSAADLHLDTLTAMGANPTPMSYSEVFTGLQQGTIDGVSTTTPLIYGDRFYEVSENMTLTNHVLLPHVLMINDDFYAKLTEDQQEILNESVEEYITYARELVIEAEKEAVEGMKAEGVNIVELTDEQREAFKEVVEPVLEKHKSDVGEENYEQALKELGK
ncbi:MAG TPA: TRAP transporter substrate-binding protein [Candidatus Pseudogracilibacillus intestinigallinarum]|uniref:TRAP transporter substrate-binding protein n=1 Tax=Candidatus Pseudogracilibacillus intestinigallinarum TaxID=2838742 RepID=A0A9D1TJN1_9BACI|nr:TRAP transporter substrate-binding protein [Candidatus Pseudogracilibacillus intestinigallinarum]